MDRKIVRCPSCQERLQSPKHATSLPMRCPNCGDTISRSHAGGRVTVSCPQCTRAYRIPEAHLGQTGKCSACGTKFALVAPCDPDAIETYRLAPSIDAAKPSETPPGSPAPTLNSPTLDSATGTNEPEAARCRGCDAPLPAGAVICVQCGYDTRRGGCVPSQVYATDAAAGPTTQHQRGWRIHHLVSALLTAFIFSRTMGHVTSALYDLSVPPPEPTWRSAWPAENELSLLWQFIRQLAICPWLYALPLVALGLLRASWARITTGLLAVGAAVGVIVAMTKIVFIFSSPYGNKLNVSALSEFGWYQVLETAGVVYGITLGTLALVGFRVLSRANQPGRDREGILAGRFSRWVYFVSAIAIITSGITAHWLVPELSPIRIPQDGWDAMISVLGRYLWPALLITCGFVGYRGPRGRLCSQTVLVVILMLTMCYTMPSEVISTGHRRPHADALASYWRFWSALPAAVGSILPWLVLTLYWQSRSTSLAKSPAPATAPSRRFATLWPTVAWIPVIIGFPILLSRMDVLPPYIEVLRPALAWLTLLMFLVIPAVLLMQSPERWSSKLGLGPIRNYTTLAIPPLIICAMAMAAQLMLAVHQQWPPGRNEVFLEVTLLSQPGPGGWVELIAAIILIPALCEELFFRGILLGALRPHLPAWACVTISAAVFSAAHLDAKQAIPLFILGIALGYLTVFSGTVFYAMLAHAFVNATAVAAAYYAWALHRTGHSLLDSITAPPEPFVFALAAFGFLLSLGFGIALRRAAGPDAARSPDTPGSPTNAARTAAFGIAAYVAMAGVLLLAGQQMATE